MQLIWIIYSSFEIYVVGNPNWFFGCPIMTLGLTTKARACKSVSRKGNLEITFHIFESVQECEGMNLPTSK